MIAEVGDADPSVGFFGRYVESLDVRDTAGRPLHRLIARLAAADHAEIASEAIEYAAE